jgi:para-aminobenzoate synthetase component 1
VHTSFASAARRCRRPGLSCFDLGPRYAALTWSAGPALEQVAGWPDAVRAMLVPGGAPWSGGVVGWVSYEAGRETERMGAAKAPALVPEIHLSRVDGFVLVDKETGAVRVRGTPSFRAEAEARLASDAQPDPSVPAGTTALDGSRDDYEAGVRRILGSIRKGDVYQANLAWRACVPAPSDPLETWLALREDNPSERGAFLDSGDVAVISNSPELFLRVRSSRGRRLAWSAPIKGTAALDEGTARLEASTKERAELTMIADLVRNDLGRVARTGSVRWGPRRIRRCGDLWHAEQRVTAELSSRRDAVDAFAACFPPASVTGAPKIAAMEIIRTLEPVPRGVYCGAIGLFGDDGQAHWNVAIRTATVVGGKAWFHVGAGIVADSDPAREWAETLAKGTRLRRALA